MNTPTHLIFAAAAFAKPEQRKVNFAILLGAFIPDLSLYLLFFWHRFVLGTSTNEIFGTLYFSDWWQFVFAIDNSFFVWGAFLAVGVAIKQKWLIGLSAAALLHLAFDLPVHNDDARAHFWPVTNWRFHSPVSYWDKDHYGNIVSTLEMITVFVLLVVLWRRFHTFLPRILIGVAGAMTFAPYLIFAVIMQLGADQPH